MGIKDVIYDKIKSRDAQKDYQNEEEPHLRCNQAGLFSNQGYREYSRMLIT